MAGIADLFIGSFNSGRALAKDRQAVANQSKLGGLFSQAYATGKPDLAGIAAVSPDAAVSAQGAFADLDEQQTKQFVQTAQVFTQAMTPEQRVQAWPGIRAELSKRIPQAQYPEMWDESLLPQAQQLAGVIAQRLGSGMPADVQEFNHLTQGLSAEDQEKARRIRLGLDGRASSAGYGFDTFAGQDGRERPYVTDPRTGAVLMYDEQAGGFLPVGGMGGPAQQGGDPFGFLAQAGVPITSGYRTPEHNAKVGGVPNSYHLSGQARDIPPPQTPEQAAFIRQQAAANGLEIIDEGDHWHLEPRGNAPRGGMPMVGRRPEDEAFAKESATQRAQLNALPEREAIQTQASITRTEAEAMAKTRAEAAAAEGKRTRGADDTLGLLDEAEKLLPRATEGALGAGVDALAGVFGYADDGARATAQLRAIAGQLTAKMPRMEGPQSNYDVQLYKEMAGDLANPLLPVETREAALQTIRALNEKYSSRRESAPASSGWSIRVKGAN